MRKGTTPYFECELPFDINLVKNAKLTVIQNEISVSKKLEDFEIEGNTLSVMLTQEETFKFDENFDCEAQMRVLATDGNVFSSDPEVFRVIKCLDDEVLV